MTAIVTRGNAMDLHLPDETVDLIVTSPPYWSLRSYQDGGEHYLGQVGDEASPGEFVDNLIRCTAEWMRVLKPGGSIFVNLGDKYSTGSSGDRNNGFNERSGNAPGKRAQERSQIRSAGVVGMQPKSLIGLPWRYAIRCIDELGLILRAEIVWAKPNGLPESVTDRVRRSHEQVFHFVKQPRYYSAVDEVREAHVGGQSGAANTFKRDKPSHTLVPGQTFTQQRADRPDVPAAHPLGKLPGSVWEIPTAPLKVPASLGIDHFAAYPPELVKRIVKGWSPREVCTACGEGRRPVAVTERTFDGEPIGKGCGGIFGDVKRESRNAGVGNWRFGSRTNITGHACACPDTSAPVTPGVVLDPFGGTGTTALVASAFGRVGVSVDLSADYCRLAQWRTTDPGERARVLGVPKPEPVPEGQLGMFEGLGA